MIRANRFARIALRIAHATKIEMVFFSFCCVSALSWHWSCCSHFLVLQCSSKCKGCTAKSWTALSGSDLVLIRRWWTMGEGFLWLRRVHIARAKGHWLAKNASEYGCTLHKLCLLHFHGRITTDVSTKSCDLCVCRLCVCERETFGLHILTLRVNMWWQLWLCYRNPCFESELFASYGHVTCALVQCCLDHLCLRQSQVCLHQVVWLHTVSRRSARSKHSFIDQVVVATLLPSLLAVHCCACAVGYCNATPSRIERDPHPQDKAQDPAKRILLRTPGHLSARRLHVLLCICPQECP